MAIFLKITTARLPALSVKDKGDGKSFVGCWHGEGLVRTTCRHICVYRNIMVGAEEVLGAPRVFQQGFTQFRLPYCRQCTGDKRLQRLAAEQQEMR